MRCPKCKYEPTEQEQLDSPEQCPSCGVFYAKYIAMLKARVEQAKASNAPAEQKRASVRAAPIVNGKTFVEQSLTGDEYVIAVFRLHWIVWVRVGIWFLLGLVTLFLTWIIAIYEIFRIRTTEHALTSKRVVYKVGVISRKTQEMRLKSMETIEIDQGIFGRVFGFGQVRVTGRGISDVTFKNIENPMDVKRRIESVYNPME